MGKALGWNGLKFTLARILMKIARRGGFLVEAGGTRLWLDSTASEEGFSLISHAHSDHFPRGSSRVIATPETAGVLQLFRNHRVEKMIRYGETLKLGEVRISAYPSGHVVGSSQFLIEADGEKLVYTGDLNTYDSVILEGAKVIESDILLLEATYGSPRYIFPSREEIYAKIIRWILDTIRRGEVPAFKVYALGKAQEIIGIVNAYLEIPVVTSWTITRITEKLSEHGLSLDYIPLHYPEGLEAFRQGECVYVSNKRYSPPSKRKLRWGAATGWALRYRIQGYDAAFPLSGHADFPGLISYAEESGARKIYLVHGFAEELSRHLRRRGLLAEALV